MVKLFAVIFVLALILTACGDNPTPTLAPAAPPTGTPAHSPTPFISSQALPASSPTSTPAVATIAPTKPTTPIITPAISRVNPFVINAKRTQGNVETRKPKDGFIYFIIDYTVTNNFPIPLNNNPTFFKVQSDRNFSYNYSDVTFLLPKGLKSSNLVPGEESRAELAFEVPTGETMKVFIYDNFTNNEISTPIP